MKFFAIFAASVFLLALQGTRAAPLTQDHHSDVRAYRSIIDQLLAAPDERLCLDRQELDEKEKTEEVVYLLNYLDQRALELHGLSCSADLDLSALSKQVSDSKFESEDSAPEAKLEAPFLLEEEEIEKVDKWKNSARILIGNAASLKSESEFEPVVASNTGELPCSKDCRLETLAEEMSSSCCDPKCKLYTQIFVVTYHVLAIFYIVYRLFRVRC